MEKVRASTTGHTAFVTAESALKQLRERERARTTLEKQKTEADKRRIDLDGKVKAAKEQADTFAKLLKKKDEELAGVRKKLTPLEDELKETVKAYEDSQAAVKQLDSDRDELRGFVRRLPEFCADREEELKKVKKLAAELAAWDAKKLTDAKSREDTAEKALQGLRDQFTQARERKEALAKQLEEIGGGMCPFLKEQCRQFDPAKVQGDVQAIEKQIKELESKDGPARKAHEDAKKEREFLSAQENQLTPKRNQLGDEIASYLRALRTLVSELVAAAAARAPKHLEGDQESFPTAPHVPGKIEDAEGLKTLHEKLVRFCEDGASWWNTLDPRIDTKLEELEKAKIQRQKDEHSLEGFKVKLVDLQKEIKGLADDEKAKRDESTGTAAEVKKAADEVSELGEQLKQYADVAEAITKQEGLLDEHRDAYKVYLTHKPIANQLKDRETELSGKKKDERKRADELKEEEQALSEAKKGFDPLQLKAARTDHEEKSKAATSCQTDLKYADQALQQEEKRFEEWKDSIKSKEAVDDELHKLAAAAELGQLARSVLQKSAPAVARHLCNRIAGRAQRIFNQINQDPIELNWEAHSYSLRIAPGDRRFAMLSGGEQTKLALSMTLAMAQEFSDLRFCIFDEPTYGVDADSRPLLADAILEAQEAAGLEQLLLVSHDDAFEGKIEHAVLLGKSAQSGSEVISLG
jgi:exonuclease SbcC